LGQVGEAYYITMEFIYGHDLRQVFKASRTKNRPINPWLVAWLGEKVAEGLDYAYNRAHVDNKVLGVVHRDISPQNIMIGFDGSVKIIDFGIAKAAISTVQTAAGVLKGKYAYMSPEHAGRRQIDHRSDIWSLGVVLYELLSGHRLFEGDVVADIIEQVLRRPIAPLKDAPQEIIDVVHGMLDRSMQHRSAQHSDVRAGFCNALKIAPKAVMAQSMADWMDELFPTEHRLEADLTDADVHLILSAEDRGETTTDQRSDISEATQIFLADNTGHTDYKIVLERMMKEGRVLTVSEAALLYSDKPGGSGEVAEMGAPSSVSSGATLVLWDAFWAVSAVIGLTLLLMWI
jgi:serine/threonine protein kinase